jgi:hypothetical protein
MSETEKPRGVDSARMRELAKNLNNPELLDISMDKIDPGQRQRIDKALGIIRSRYFVGEGRDAVVSSHLTDEDLNNALEILDAAHSLAQDFYAHPERYAKLDLQQETPVPSEESLAIIDEAGGELMNAAGEYRSIIKAEISKRSNAPKTEEKLVEKNDFDSRKYVNEDLANQDPFKSLGYAELRSYTTNYAALPKTPQELDAILARLDEQGPLIDGLRKESRYLAAEPAKRDLINNIVLEDFSALRKEVARLRNELVTNEDDRQFGEWKRKILNKSPFKELNLLRQAALPPFGVKKYEELESLIAKTDTAITTEVQKGTIPVPRRADAEEFLRNDVLKKAQDTLDSWKGNLLSQWKKDHLPQIYKEFEELDKLKSSIAIPRTQSSESIKLYRAIKDLKEHIEAEKNTYLQEIPLSLQADGAIHITNVVSTTESQLLSLKTEATDNLKREVSGIKEVKDLSDAIQSGNSPKTASIDIQTQEQEINNAMSALDINKLVYGFDPDLRNEARADIEKVIDKVPSVLDNLRQAKDEALKREQATNASATVEATKVRRRKIISDILDLASKPEKSNDSFWFVNIDTLKEWQKNLAEEIASASKPGGVPMEPTEYREAKDRIDKFVEDREKFTEKEMEKIWGEMRANFRKPSDSTTDPVAELYKIADKLDEIYGTDHKNRYKALEGLWKAMVDAGSKAESDEIVQNLVWNDTDKAFHVMEGYSTDIDAFLAYDKPINTDFDPANPSSPKVIMMDIVNFVDDIFAAGDYMTYKGIAYNYGSKGNPNQNDASRGVPTITDILEDKYPNVPKSVIKAMGVDQIMCTFARYPYLQPFYETWDQSPVGVQDFKPVTVSSPLSYCSYNEIKGRNTPKGYRVKRRLLRYPEHRFKQDALPHGSDIKYPKYGTPDNNVVRINIRDTEGRPTGRTEEARRPKDSFKASQAQINLEEAAWAANRANREVMQMDIETLNPNTLRTMTRDDGSPLPFPPEHIQMHAVEVGSDGITFPYYAHIARGRYPGKMPLSSYYKAYKAYDEFGGHIEDGPKITKEDEIASQLKFILGDVSVFKGVLGILRVKKGDIPNADAELKKHPEWEIEKIPDPKTGKDVEYVVHPHYRVLVNEVRMMALDYIRAEWQQLNEKASISVWDSIRAGHPGLDPREHFLKIVDDNLSGDAPDEIRFFLKNVIQDAMIPTDASLIQGVANRTLSPIDALKKKAETYWRPMDKNKNPNKNLFSPGWTAVSGKVDVVDAVANAHERELRHQYLEIDKAKPEGRKDKEK